MPYRTVAIEIAAITILLAVEAQNSTPRQTRSTPALVNTCLITQDVQQLTKFYAEVLRISARKASAEYAEFPTGVGVLAIFSAKAQEQYIPRSAQAASNRSAILEFEV